jgi:hypothetical protein
MSSIPVSSYEESLTSYGKFSAIVYGIFFCRVFLLWHTFYEYIPQIRNIEAKTKFIQLFWIICCSPFKGISRMFITRSLRQMHNGGVRLHVISTELLIGFQVNMMLV